MTENTEKLFWDDPYMQECDATVTGINENTVTLDKTIFYAFSGGQQSDSGTIGEIPVTDAIAEKDGSMRYVLESKPEFEIGDTVKVKIDQDKRMKIMRLHSAAHAIYFLFEKVIDSKKIIGSNVTVDKSRLDYEYPDNIAEFLPALEAEANELFAQDLPVSTYFDTECVGKRWWEPEAKSEWKCPCGGTHVKNLNEIGKIKLKRKNIGAGKERIEIKLAE